MDRIYELGADSVQRYFQVMQGRARAAQLRAGADICSISDAVEKLARSATAS